MNIYLLRHGQTNINRNGKYQSSVDKDLNNLGRRQAELLGKRLKNHSIDIIYSNECKIDFDATKRKVTIVKDWIN